jgi:hypothetical protein
MKILGCSENLQSQPRGQLKSLRTIAPDPRRWSGWQGPAADARRAGGAGCEDSALTRRAGGPRALHFPARQLSSLCCLDDITVTTSPTTTTISLNTLHAVFLVLCSGKLGSMDDAFGFSSLLTPMVESQRGHPHDRDGATAATTGFAVAATAGSHACCAASILAVPLAGRRADDAHSHRPTVPTVRPNFYSNRRRNFK